MIVTNTAGRILAAVGAAEQNAFRVADRPAISAALRGRDSVSLLPQPNGILQVVTVPLLLGEINPEILGTLSVGFPLDDALARQLKENSGSDIAFGMDGKVLAGTQSREDRGALTELLGLTDLSGSVRIDNEDYVVLSRPLASKGDGL